jgi:hypothetical protein
MAEIKPNKYRHNFRNLTDLQFGRLKVIGLNPVRTKSRQARWDCICACGNETTVTSNHLIGRRIVSCGCYKRDTTIRIMTKHKLKHSPEYASWRGAKNRCFQVKHSGYSNYGGRGITMCEEWRNDFLTFLRDMGPRPYGRSLDRINNDGNYEPGNCRWATPKEQAMNSRRHLKKPSIQSR